MRLTLTAVAVAAAAALTGCSAPATPAPAPVSYDIRQDAPTREDAAATYPPCATDETGAEIPPCFWDAKTRGNKIGHSFIWDGVSVTYVG